MDSLSSLRRPLATLTLLALLGAVFPLRTEATPLRHPAIGGAGSSAAVPGGDWHRWLAPAAKSAAPSGSSTGCTPVVSGSTTTTTSPGAPPPACTSDLTPSLDKQWTIDPNG